MMTNAARILERLGIRFELRDYEVDEADLSAENVAGKVGDRTGVLLAVLPGSATLDLKALAKLSGNRSVETVALKEVQPLTGYIRGGVTALACKKDYPVFVDETIQVFDTVAVSAGIRGTQIVLAPADYLRATNATTGAIACYRVAP
jgi:Cys-tRNA(Pro)/Cys-tRNA(Cys) deacylase